MELHFIYSTLGRKDRADGKRAGLMVAAFPRAGAIHDQVYLAFRDRRLALRFIETGFKNVRANYKVVSTGELTDSFIFDFESHAVVLLESEDDLKRFFAEAGNFSYADRKYRYTVDGTLTRDET